MIENNSEQTHLTPEQRQEESEKRQNRTKWQRRGALAVGVLILASGGYAGKKGYEAWRYKQAAEEKAAMVERNRQPDSRIQFALDAGAPEDAIIYELPQGTPGENIRKHAKVVFPEVKINEDYQTKAEVQESQRGLNKAKAGEDVKLWDYDADGDGTSDVILAEVSE
ncbi:hypothetical protein FWF48_00140 [Candidatus Saccharibacteria bacterium]|nr:hypothetical protein [Candidatus Saccharibacteria bacterium]